jgi:TRAP-type C4-dicarboxylate transport system permease small subunit
VVGLIPAMAWPYWTVNVALAVGFGVLWFRHRPRAVHRPRAAPTA